MVNKITHNNLQQYLILISLTSIPEVIYRIELRALNTPLPSNKPIIWYNRKHLSFEALVLLLDGLPKFSNRFYALLSVNHP